MHHCAAGIEHFIRCIHVCVGVMVDRCLNCCAKHFSYGLVAPTGNRIYSMRTTLFKQNFVQHTDFRYIPYGIGWVIISTSSPLPSLNEERVRDIHNGNAHNIHTHAGFKRKGHKRMWVRDISRVNGYRFWTENLYTYTRIQYPSLFINKSKYISIWGYIKVRTWVFRLSIVLYEWYEFFCTFYHCAQ